MDAEILFFMSAKDQSNFLDVAEKHCDSIHKLAQDQFFEFTIGNCKLIFTPSVFEKNTLFVGSLEIRLGAEKNISDQEQAKTVFRKLRNWLKKHYWSRLAYKNINKKGKLTPSRNYWLGPDAKRWKESDENEHVLQLSKSSWMVFKLGY